MITPVGFTYEKFYFPVGEMHVKGFKSNPGQYIDIEFNFERNDEIIELLLLVNTIKHEGCFPGTLYMPYVPFSRQDRINEYGECFSLEVFAELLNSCGFQKVVVTDPHSDVTPALIKNCSIISQEYVFRRYFKGKNEFYLISPDGGSLKKIYKLAAVVDCYDVIECSKLRNTKTGEITGVKVHFDDFGNKDCYIVDDICDGGRTFIEIAKELQKKKAGRIILMVTHGFFTKGIQVFDGLIDEIYTSNGRIK